MHLQITKFSCYTVARDGSDSVNYLYIDTKNYGHTKERRCLAAANPSPPLLPGPHTINTFEGFFGYTLANACAQHNPITI